MSKILNDKYYTPIDLASKCIKKVNELIPNISSYIEPSAGNGSFSLLLPIEKTIAYDIEPEHHTIIKQDYLELEIPYQKDRLVIGNPPFGEKLLLAQRFFKKSIEIADYIAFILPISQLWNTNSLYEFDLIYSVDLGKLKYSDRMLHCCFNIYKRPENGLNKKPTNKLKHVKIIRQDSKNYSNEPFDIRMCYWGNGSAGKILKDNETYSAEYKLQVSENFKDNVKEVLNNINWFNELNCIAMLKIQQFHIIKVLKKYIPDIV